MIEVIYSIVGFFIGYKLGNYQVEKIVRMEVERQIATLTDWTMKNDN
jgi:hypothetical protein